MTNRERRMTEIKREARKIFRAEGYSGTRVDLIAKAADLSVGGFYLYFESKEALFSELLAEDLAGSGGDWIPVLAGYLPFPMPEVSL